MYPGFRCDIPDWQLKLADFPEPAPQQTDFIECIRTRRPFALNETNGFRSCSLVNLDAVAIQLNGTLRFDKDTMEFINDPAADLLLEQRMRGPWYI